MRRRIAAVGPLASESSSHRGPFLEDFRNLTATVAKYSLVRARQNPCAAGTGTVFSQTLGSFNGRQSWPWGTGPGKRTSNLEPPRLRLTSAVAKTLWRDKPARCKQGGIGSPHLRGLMQVNLQFQAHAIVPVRCVHERLCSAN